MRLALASIALLSGIIREVASETDRFRPQQLQDGVETNSTPKHLRGNTIQDRRLRTNVFSNNGAGNNKGVIPANGKKVKDSYIVVLDDDTQNVNAAAEAHLRAVNAKNPKGMKWKSAIKGFAAQMNAAKAKAMANRPGVKYVEETGISTISYNWGIDRIDQRNLPLDSAFSPRTTSHGNGVAAFILDTGIRASHDAFGGRAINDSYFDWHGGSGDDCHGHGTHVGGTIGGINIGVAEGVLLVAARVCDCNGSCPNDDIIDAINKISQLCDPTDNGAGTVQYTGNSDLDTFLSNHSNLVGKKCVANISLGGGKSTSENDALDGMVSNGGVVVAVSAGNDNDNACNYSPASAPMATTVGSTTSTDTRSSFSNWGSCVDIFSPGSSIYSAVENSDTSYESWSGTSMASPHVCGAAALIRGDDPSLSAQQVDQRLKENSSINKISNIGTGSPNKLLYAGGCANNSDCDDGNQCTTDTCNTDEGICVFTPKNVGFSCNDDDACTTGDACTAASICMGQYQVSDQCPQMSYSSQLKCPCCHTVSSTCSSGPDLLDGRGANLGPEANHPNNFGSTCPDGASGTYHGDESIDKLVVRTLGGENFSPDSDVEIVATVWAWGNGSSDYCDFYYAPDALNPVWTHINTVQATKGGEQELTSQTFKLATGGSELQGFRANFRYQGSASYCSGGSWDEADDLVVAVSTSGTVPTTTTSTSTTTSTTTPVTTTTTPTSTSTSTAATTTTSTSTTTPAATTSTSTTTSTTTPVTTTTTPTSTTTSTTTTTPVTTTTTPTSTSTSTTTTTPAVTMSTSTTTSTTTTSTTSTTTSLPWWCSFVWWC